ncbi:MAG: beta-galactosidase trimerization domain-containing protein [Chloroflexi bacterium]|nr:beta-galactosidase trimerization domain-containing protein [Chloroflexota bacterium]
MRWAQLTFTEDDPAVIDLDFWMDYFRRIAADGAVLSTGGYIAYYPTKIPLHHRSDRLGSRDLFGEAVARCREMGMAVIARTDPHAARNDVFETHPDWIAVEANGQPRRHWATPGVWVTCALGPYNFEFMTAVNNEIMREYRVDALFGNRWAGSGMCYCEHCQRNFAEASGGLALPRTGDPRDPARRAYMQWRQDRLFALWDLWDRNLRAINPEGHYVPNSGGGALSTLNMRRVGERAYILFADRQSRHGVMPPWAAGKNGKEYRAALGDKPVGGIFSVGVEEKYRWKDSVQTGPELRVWVGDAIAQGMRPWFTKFSGTVHDGRWLPVVEELYRWHADAEPYLRNEANLAEVGLVYSQQTAAFYGGEAAQATVEDHTLGWYQALVEARIPFEMVHDELLDPARLSRFKALILPNVACLSDEQCAQLRAFVEAGGGLVATHETSLYDETGAPRPDFGLADLFGASVAGPVEGPMKNAYLRVEDAADGSVHPLLAGLEDAQRPIHGVYRLPTTPTAPLAATPLTLVPPYPDLPMEEVYPRQPATETPEVYIRQVGLGRVVYFPWDIDRAFWELLTPDHGRLLGNAAVWAAGDDPLLTVSGSGLLDVAVWQQKASLAVHLVNLTNPFAMRGAMRELIPVGAFTVCLRLPNEVSVRGVRLLRAGQDVPFAVEEGRLWVKVPLVTDFEVVGIDL